MTRAVAISLKIPDNEAYTALVALRRLGVAADRVERAAMYFFDDAGDIVALRQRVVSDETIFNPNKHRLSVLDEAAPRDGEVWIEPLDARGVTISWRLFSANGAPVERAVLDMATERLLCNPAIDRAITQGEKAQRTCDK
jgi:hypothetical protein